MYYKFIGMYIYLRTTMLISVDTLRGFGVVITSPKKAKNIKGYFN